MSPTLPVAVIGAVMVAFGYGSSQPALQAMSLQTETPLRRGVASNTLYIGYDLGFFIGPLCGGLVYGISDYRVMFVSSSAVVALAIVGFLLIMPAHRRRMGELE